MASEACCDAGPPIASEYTGEGKEEKLGDLPVYVVGEEKGTEALVVLYDIFGFNIANNRRVCDKLADAGFFVIMPDFFRGLPWKLEDMPPQQDVFGKWWAERANDTIVRNDLATHVLPFLKSKGMTSIGALGMCWGGLMSLSVCAADSNFKAAGSIHGARLEAKHAEAAQCPCMILPASNDPHYDPLKTVLDTKPFADKCVYKVFTEEQHGFCAARGDWKTKTGDAAAEAILMSIEFFNDNFTA